MSRASTGYEVLPAAMSAVLLKIRFSYTDVLAVHKHGHLFRNLTFLKASFQRQQQQK